MKTDKQVTEFRKPQILSRVRNYWLSISSLVLSALCKTS